MADSAFHKSVFVTGGTGFVGSHLVDALLERGVSDIRCLVRGDAKWLDGKPVTLVRGDLFTLDALHEGMSGADAAYHVAGMTRARDQATLDRANVQGTLNVVTAARESDSVSKLLITSSLEAMGPNSLAPDGSAVPATEAENPRPISMYGRSKARMEEAVWVGRGDLPTVIVRPPAVYGPREADIFEMIKGASRGLFPIVGDGNTPRLSLVHSRDLVDGMIAAATTPSADGQTYFVGSDRGYSWEEIRAAMEAALDRKTLRLPVPRALMGTAGAVSEGVGRLVGKLPPLTRDKAEAARHAWIASIEKAQSELGYAPKTPLDQGMTETVRWYREAGWL